MSTEAMEPARVGAARAARRLLERVGRPVSSDDVLALVKAGVLGVSEVWRGHDLFGVAVLARADRMLTRNQAVEHLRIRPADFKNLLEAGVVVADGQTVVSLPHLSRRATTTADLYSVAQLDEVAARADLAELWAAARAAGPRSPSPFRRLAPRARSRADIVRAVAQQLADLWGCEVWTGYTPGPLGGWSITADISAGTITHAGARDAVERHPLLAGDVMAGKVVYGDPRLHTVSASRTDLQPGAAVILDTETTGLAGYIVELAVVDAATGEVLLDTFVQPGEPVEEEAQTVHGISDVALRGAPALAEVLPQLVEAVGGRTILAYNADFDLTTLRRHAKRDGLELGELGRSERWDCLMERNREHTGAEYWEALNGGHRAAGDCLAAREVLIAMASLPPVADRVTTHYPHALDGVKHDSLPSASVLEP